MFFRVLLRFCVYFMAVLGIFFSGKIMLKRFVEIDDFRIDVVDYFSLCLRFCEKDCCFPAAERGGLYLPTDFHAEHEMAYLKTPATLRRYGLQVPS